MVLLDYVLFSVCMSVVVVAARRFKQPSLRKGGLWSADFEVSLGNF